MKRLRSSDDLNSFGEKSVCKDWGRREEDSGLSRPSSHRTFYCKSENARKGFSSSSSRYDRLDDDRESSRLIRKRSDYDSENYDRRKSYDRYRDVSDRRFLSPSPRGGYSSGDRIHRSESFSGFRKDFPKRFRSERDRSRREGSVSSWRRFGAAKDLDEGARNDGDIVRGTKSVSDDRGNLRSPRGPKEAKSPPWSKDSGSEMSKSVEVKKSDGFIVESGSSSEMEEGELEPDNEPACESKPAFKDQINENDLASEDQVPENDLASEDQSPIRLNHGQKELGSGSQAEKIVEDGTNSPSEVEYNKDGTCEEKAEVRPQETVKDWPNEVDESPSNLVQGKIAHENITEALPDDEGSKKEDSPREINICKAEETKGASVGNLTPLEEVHKEEKSIDLEGKRADAYLPESNKSASGGTEIPPKEDKGVDLELRSDDIALPESNKGVSGEGEVPEIALSVQMDGIASKDKGKSIVVSPSNVSTYVEVGMKVEREAEGIFSCGDNDAEGPSINGLQLFLNDPVKKPEKTDQTSIHQPKDEKLVLEPLDLSLSLPNVLLPINSHSMVRAPVSPSHARSGQSFPSTFRTKSDGFSMSMSFSGSQPYTHNPSCSLTHNSIDNYEQSVGSRPLFHGMDQVSPATWHGQSSSEHKNKEILMHQRIVSNGNGFYDQSPSSQTTSTGQGVQGQQVKVAEGTSTMPIRLDRQMSLHRQLSGVRSRHQNDVRSSSQSVGSHENGSEYGKSKKWVMREKDSSSLHRNHSQNEKDQLLIGGADFAESIITMVVSEPVDLMANRFNEMTGQSIACLKQNVRDLILNAGKCRQLCAFQSALQNRSDITLDLLLKSHRAQLEILISLKTGLEEFLQRNDEISTSELAEIFLNLRCRNLTCRNLLPVDECDCKVCIQKNGFCSSCMCLVCSKFDMASNTCSWVGCDVCLHWCHANCALRESYIRNGRSASGPTEMQFHCVACDHPSEMFGFVKEVFQNFAREWTAETLTRELEYVRRIFSASEDARGKQLHNLAVLMISKLANKSDVRKVQSQIMSFLAESTA
ncbi:protein OBERON 4 isoform X2 [Diospyros lotus]|uniref:protein OBERON 4 isoform X2 n=1 Tax=Diospyros lotus TaxID=55363 RepID=UPI002258C50A|nr:protein OBERON 4 isoform X2 [Diospyros lotus]